MSEEDKNTQTEQSDGDADGEHAPEQAAADADASGEAAPDQDAPEAAAPEEEAAADAAPDQADADEAPAATPKERRKRQRSLHRGEARPERSPEERAAERAEARRRRAAERRRWRLRRREKRRAGGPAAGPATTPPVAPGGRGRRRVRQGVVVSDKADKTITVRIDVTRRHRTYKKIVRESSMLHVHDERNDAGVGDTVEVLESRPLSRTKRWRLVGVLERAR